MMAGEGTPKNAGKSAGPVGILVLILVVAIAVVIVLASYSAYIDFAGEEAPVLHVEIRLSDGEYDDNADRWITQIQSYGPYVKNLSSDVEVSLIYVDALEAPADGTFLLGERPVLVVYAFNMDDNWKTGKASTKYIGPGDYVLNITFPHTPQTGDLIKIVFEVAYDKDVYPTEDAYPLFDFDRSTVVYRWGVPNMDVGLNRFASSEFNREAIEKADGAVESYRWFADPEEGVVFGSPDKAMTSISATADGTYEIVIEATDAQGNIGYDSFIMLWDTIAPSVDIGPDVNSTLPINKVAVASDANGISNYTWSRVSGPGYVTFSSQYAPITDINASVPGNYTIQLNIIDKAGNVAVDEFIWVFEQA